MEAESLSQRQNILFVFGHCKEELHVDFLRYVFHYMPGFEASFSSLVESGVLVQKEGFVRLSDEFKSEPTDILPSETGGNMLLSMLADSDANRIEAMCVKAQQIAEMLLAANHYFHLRFFYSIAVYCFLSVQISADHKKECQTFIDATYALLIIFSSFPFLLLESKEWYIKANNLSFDINYSVLQDALLASTFLFGQHDSEGEAFLFSAAPSPSSLFPLTTMQKENFSDYMSIRYFFDGEFRESINCIYEKNNSPKSKLWTYSRLLYVYAAASACHLGEYGIALDVLKLGIAHARKCRYPRDVQTLTAISAYVCAFQSKPHGVEETCRSILASKQKYVVTYAELWAVRALATLYYRNGEDRKAFAILKEYLHDSVVHGIIYVGFRSSANILEMMTEWQCKGMGHPFDGDIRNEIAMSQRSPSALLRIIAQRCEIRLQAQENGWGKPAIRSALENMLTSPVLKNSPIHIAKTKLMLCRCHLAAGSLKKAENCFREAQEVCLRYGSPILPGDLAMRFSRGRNAEQPLEITSPAAHKVGLDKNDAFLATSASMKELLHEVALLAHMDTPVCIRGESGVGKELIAHRLHEQSGRKGKFIAVNLTSIPENLFENEFFGHEKGSFTGANSSKVGLLELADGGTLFLDEVADIPQPMQVKLLRILQEKTFSRVGGTAVLSSDFRIISATNKNLEEAVKNGEFRQDLYFRIHVFPLYIPPLRERRNEIIFIAEHFLDMFAQKYSLPPLRFSDEDIKLLTSYGWPGNVRELKNYIERYAFLKMNNQDGVVAPGIESVDIRESYKENDARQEKANTLTDIDSFPHFILSTFKTSMPSLESLKNAYIEYAFRAAGGKVAGSGSMADILGVSKATAYNYVEKLELEEKYKKIVVKKDPY